MSKTFKKKKKWWDDEWDMCDNQNRRKINKKKRHRYREGDVEEEQDFLARKEYPSVRRETWPGNWREIPPRK